MMEDLLARVCAPALAGIKPSNMASVDKQKYPQYAQELERLNAQLSSRGIRFEILWECPARALVLVYRPKRLEETLKQRGIGAILRSFGYDPTASLEGLLNQLRCRMCAQQFPHEIGAFLGYPPEDIRGFLKDSRDGVLLVGEWKVYSNAEAAKKLFTRYAACRKSLARRLDNGNTLAQIFCAA